MLKGRKPSRKCVSYIKRMIEKEKWVPNQQIPTIMRLSDILNVSQPTVRKAIRFYEDKGIIENCGSAGFYLVSPLIKETRKRSINAALTARLRKNIEAHDLLYSGAKQIKNWLIKNNDSQRIKALNLVSGILLECSIDELNYVKTNEINLDFVLSSKGREFKKRKDKYLRQESLRQLSYIVLFNKQELGINV